MGFLDDLVGITKEFQQISKELKGAKDDIVGGVQSARNEVKDIATMIVNRPSTTSQPDATDSSSIDETKTDQTA